MFIPFHTQGANLTLKGSVTTRGEYDDNVFLTSDNEIEDFITTVSPGISGQYKLNQNNFFDLIYGADLIFHKKSTPFVEDEVRHNLKASLRLNPMEYIYFSADDTYYLIPIDSRESGRFKGKFNNLAKRNFFQAGPSIKYPLGSTSYTNLELKYSKSSVNEKGINEKEEWTSSFEIGKSFSSAIKSSANYTYGDTRQTVSQDYYSHSFSGKIIYKPTEHTESTLAGGIIKRFTSSNGGLNSSFINFNLKQIISPAIDVSLALNRSLEDNEERRNAKRSAVERTSVTGAWNYRISEMVLINGNGFYRLDSFKQVNREDKLLGGSLNFLIYFSRYISLILNGKYNKNNYSSESQDRVDKMFFGSSSLEFQPYEWLKFGTMFQTEKRNSNNLNEDYKVKRYSFYGTISF